MFRLIQANDNQLNSVAHLHQQKLPKPLPSVRIDLKDLQESLKFTVSLVDRPDGIAIPMVPQRAESVAFCVAICCPSPAHGHPDLQTVEPQRLFLFGDNIYLIMYIYIICLWCIHVCLCWIWTFLNIWYQDPTGPVMLKKGLSGPSNSWGYPRVDPSPSFWWG